MPLIQTLFLSDNHSKVGSQCVLMPHE
jgi:hypothetical protein